MGLFENPYPDPKAVNYVGLDESNKFNEEATKESIVLAKNRANILPIKRGEKKILVTGPTANLLRILNGGWSYDWQGSNEAYYYQYGKYKLTLANAINRTNGESGVKFVEGANLTMLTNVNEAVEEAKKSDLIVLAIGEDVYAETPGNIFDLRLPQYQFDLADALFKLGKPVVVVYFGGRPRVITEIAEKADAVLFGFLPGPRGTEAIADIIFGNYNPNGRLPVSYPRHRNGFTTYDRRALEDTYYPLYEFGHGLSYTTFQYRDLNVNPKLASPTSKIEVSVHVQNTGTRAGKETVLLYLNDEYASVSRPVKQLKRFAKIYLEPGQDQTVRFELTIDDLSFINAKSEKVYEEGTFNVYIEKLTNSFKLRK